VFEITGAVVDRREDGCKVNGWLAISLRC